MKVGDLVQTLEGTSGVIIKVNDFAYQDGQPRIDMLSSSGKILISISQLVLKVIK